MLYFAGIRALGEKTYIESGQCLESGFANWLKRGAALKKKTGKRMFVDFRQRPHSFEVESDGTSHLLTPETSSIADPAATFLEAGD